MPTSIEFFEVTPHADEAFLAAWRAERMAGATLFRALREDVAARFVSVAPGAGTYELVHEDGDVEGAGGVVLIHGFSVLDGWDRVRDVLAARRGYLGTRLFRGTGAPRFVHIGRWSSPLMVFRAVREPEFLRAAEPIGFPTRPALYQPV